MRENAKRDVVNFVPYHRIIAETEELMCLAAIHLKAHWFGETL
jgi:hypothetical protein